MGSWRSRGRDAVTAVRSWRESGLPVAAAGAADPDVLALVDEPFTDVGDARERLTRLERLLYERRDGRASFLTVYARVTTEVERGILDDAFEDPAWVADYLVTFANYYREAFAAYERGDLDAVPDPWQLSFGAALAPDTLVLQDVLLGVNAHVNYDLALTLDTVGIDGDRRRCRADHDAINDVLDRLVDVQQDRLAARYAAGIADVDAALGDLDERLSSLALRRGRHNAWLGAVALGATPSPLLRRGVDRLLDRFTTAVGYLLLLPVADSGTLEALHAVEDGSVRFDPDDPGWRRLVERSGHALRTRLTGLFGR